ncbi:MAG TPA: RDD family protein [Rubrivivax sp.]|nr:RDD family protein [Rubrivivax sp.]
MSLLPAQAGDALQAPALRRRMACFVYEGVLLFGVVMLAGLLYSILTNQRHALIGTTGLQVLLFMVLGVYFVYFWSRTGQTLAMQTWHIRLVTRHGQPVSSGRALCRYFLSWLWFVPALLAAQLSGLKTGAASFSAIIVGVLTYAALVWLRSDRQFWHDVVCGTRLVTHLPTGRASSRASK